MIIALLYRLILAMAIILILWTLITHKEVKWQINAAIILMPFILRVLMIG
jgi:hypothetical protein